METSIFESYPNYGIVVTQDEYRFNIESESGKRDVIYTAYKNHGQQVQRICVNLSRMKKRMNELLFEAREILRLNQKLWAKM